MGEAGLAQRVMNGEVVADRREAQERAGLRMGIEILLAVDVERP